MTPRVSSLFEIPSLDEILPPPTFMQSATTALSGYKFTALTNMDGKVALVTGGARGIGKAVAEALLSKYVKVSVVDIDDTVGVETQKELAGMYGAGNIIFLKCDITLDKDMEDAFYTTRQTFGDLNIVCNVAGCLDERRWERMAAVNLNGTIRSTLLALKYMGTVEGSRGGVVVNIASVDGLIPVTRTPVYGATKAAIVFFTKSIGPGAGAKNNVRVNCLCPVAVNTPLLETAFKEPGKLAEPLAPEEKQALFENILQPAEVAAHVLRLVEDETLNGAVFLLSFDRRLVEIDLPSTEGGLKTVPGHKLSPE